MKKPSNRTREICLSLPAQSTHSVLSWEILFLFWIALIVFFGLSCSSQVGSDSNDLQTFLPDSCTPNAVETVACSETFSHALAAEETHTCNAEGTGYLVGPCQPIACVCGYEPSETACLERSVHDIPKQFYVDPDVAPAGDGTSAAPWTKLDNAAWAKIDQALVKDDVVVFFSAKDAQTLENEKTGDNILIQRSDEDNPHRLVLDGMSKYNTDDQTPTWTDGDGTTKFEILARYPMLSKQETMQNCTTLRGFKLIGGLDGNGSGKALGYWGGNHVIWEHLEATQHPLVNDGPGMMFGYAFHKNNTGATIVENGGCEDLIIRNNLVHHTYGEAIYIGGSNDTGENSHRDVLVENNTIYNAGFYGAQGDCIDTKDGMTNVTIRGNYCANSQPEDNVNGLALGSATNLLVEDNIIENAPVNGITISTYWGLGFFDVVIRKNLIFGSGQHGLKLNTDDVDRPIVNAVTEFNTIVDNQQAGIELGHPGDGRVANMRIANNEIVNNGSCGLCAWGGASAWESAVGEFTISDNNVFSNTVNYQFPIPDQTGQNDNISVDPLFLDTTNPPGTDNIFRTTDDGYIHQCDGGNAKGFYACY